MSKKKEELKENISSLMEELTIWDKHLEGKEWLANTFSIADIAIFPVIAGCVYLGLDLDSNLPK